MKTGRNFNNKRAVAEPVAIEPEVDNGNTKREKRLIAAQQYVGPIPPAEEFAKYGQVIPDAPERILKVFEADSEHTRNMQRLALEGEIKRDRRGQWMAFTVLLAIIIIIIISLYLGNVAFAGIAGLAFLAFAAKGFLRGSGTNSNNNKTSSGKKI